MKHFDIRRYAPPGIRLGQMGGYLAFSLFIGILASVWMYYSELAWIVDIIQGDLPHYRGMYDAGAPDFVEVLGSSLVFFPLFALGSVLFVIYHYAYHFTGSRSIYLMRRLPDRWELHRRCLTLPGAMAALFLLIGFLLLLIFYLSYHTSIPASYIQPHQWAKLWR